MAEMPMPTLDSIEPKFGEPGFNKGKSRPCKGTPRARVTERNAYTLAFVGTFPGADDEAISMIATALKGPRSDGGSLRTIATVQMEMRKLIKLGAVESFRNPATGVVHYGCTKLGFDYARAFGYDMKNGSTLNGISLERLTHYRLIALVAAQFISPIGWFEDTLGVGPVDLRQMVSEHKMRGAFAPVANHLKTARKAGQPADHGKLRLNNLRKAAQAAASGTTQWHQMIARNLDLLTIGVPKHPDVATKSTHQPDLAVYLDTARTDQKARNLLVEVEINKKSYDEYDQILRTLAIELKQGLVYERAVYFTVSPTVAKLIRKVDADGDHGLIASNKLILMQIQHRNYDPVQLQRRVVIGAN